jgi:AraC-like DNA-binding protein
MIFSIFATRMKKLISILVVLCCASSLLFAQENPFMRMADMKYAAYSEELSSRFVDVYNLRDSVEGKKFICQIREVAEKTGSIYWELEADLLELELFYYIHAEEHPEKSLDDLFKLLKKAKKTGVLPVELKLRHLIINIYMNIRNYELALDQCNMQDQLLQGASSEDIPEKSGYYLMIANIYYKFKDYDNAIVYCDKTLNDKETVSNEWPRQHALNTKGLCYRYGYNDLIRSDSCFSAILDIKCIASYNENRRESWEGIVEGNMGNNMVLRGEYSKAISLLESSIRKMVKYGDYAFASGPAIELAYVYLEKGNTTTAKQYIDLANEYYTRMPREGRLTRIYEVMSKYYIAKGNINMSIAYMDSMLLEKTKDEQEFNALQLMRMEQRKHLSEQKIKDEQLNTEKVRSAGYRKSLIIAVIGLLLAGGVLVFYIALYRKKKEAYRELVRKSQEWAQVSVADTEPEASTTVSEQIEAPELPEQKKQPHSPDDVDFLIMKDIEHLMMEEKLYRDNMLSVELLAQKLGAKRHYVSTAINHCRNKSFNTFVNEYRIKEAVRRISDCSERFSFEGIAFEIGFSDRTNFYRVFKKMTGLSPAEFRDNLLNH